MAPLQEMGLSYSQTIFRTLAYVGGEVEVRGLHHPSGGVWVERGVLLGAMEFSDDPEPERLLYVLEDADPFMLDEALFVEGEVIGGVVLRIEQGEFTLMMAAR
jgi:hypothetical protein